MCGSPVLQSEGRRDQGHVKVAALDLLQLQILQPEFEGIVVDLQPQAIEDSTPRALVSLIKGVGLHGSACLREQRDLWPAEGRLS
jgi:hypothetical protein